MHVREAICFRAGERYWLVGYGHCF
jgi:hypothetical protein